MCSYSRTSIYKAGKSSLYPRSKLCSVDGVWSGTDYKNFIVDFKSNTISYDKIYSLSDFYKPKMKKLYISKGKTEIEADQIVNRKPKPKKVKHYIKNVIVSSRNLYIDPITKERYIPSKKIRSFNVSYEDSVGELYSLSYAENIPEAIITAFLGNSEYSWLQMHFGKCRMIDWTMNPFFQRLKHLSNLFTLF